MSFCKERIKKERRIFARNFKNARLDAGLTQTDVVKITGFTQAFISEVENSRCSLTLDSATCLADAVKQPLKDLLDPDRPDTINK